MNISYNLLSEVLNILPQKIIINKHSFVPAQFQGSIASTIAFITSQTFFELLRSEKLLLYFWVMFQDLEMSFGTIFNLTGYNLFSTSFSLFLDSKVATSSVEA